MDGSCSWRFVSPCHPPPLHQPAGEKKQELAPHSTTRANHRATKFPARNGGPFERPRRSTKQEQTELTEKWWAARGEEREGRG